MKRENHLQQHLPKRLGFLPLSLIILGLISFVSAETQSFSLVSGWNWVSFHVQPENIQLIDFFASIQQQLTAVKSQTRSAIYTNNQWIGDLTDMGGIGRGEMFKLHVTSACTLTIEGNRVDPEIEIPLGNGWNWVSYLPSSALDLGAALSSILGQIEMVKSQTRSAVFTNGQWLGDLEQMEPDLGYVILLNGPSILRYPSPETEHWVVVHHPCYQWNMGNTGIPWEDITHLVLDYLLLQPISSSNWTVHVPDYFPVATWNQRTMEWISAGHAAGRTVCCLVGGAGSNTGANNQFWNLATSEVNVALFAQNIRSVLQSMGFDGVDLDWEEQIDYSGFLRLVQELRRIWPEALITIPTGFSGLDAENFAPLQDHVDAFMPMSYLSIEQWGGWRIPVPLSPLFPFATNPYGARLTLNRWIAAGVSPSKVVMGVGGYGAVWGDSNGDGRAPIAPYVSTTTGLAEGERSAIFTDNYISQTWVSQTLHDHPELVANWDDVGKCSYWSAPAADRLVRANIGASPGYVDVGSIFYETPRSIGEKSVFIRNNDMKGMMFWSLHMMLDGDGTFPNLTAANNGLHKLNAPNQMERK